MDVIRRLVAEWYPDERSLGTRVTGMVAECVLAALVITATFVTTERPVRLSATRTRVPKGRLRWAATSAF